MEEGREVRGRLLLERPFGRDGSELLAFLKCGCKALFRSPAQSANTNWRA